MITNKEQKIQCPACGELISIDDVLTRQIEERIKSGLAVEQKVKEQELKNKIAEVNQKELEIVEARRSLDISVAQKVNDQINKEKIELWKKARIEAEKEKESEKKFLEEQIKEKDEKLVQANQESLKLRIERQKLDIEKQEFELKIQRQIDEERKKIGEEASKKASEENQYIIAQLKKQLTDATKAKDDLARKLEQGSQQTQGEVLELELEEILKTEFITDEILPVPKGVNGADIVHRVNDRFGRFCGQIVWESKKTKNWTDAWIQKLKDDQRAVKADVAVIVSTVLPDGVQGFSLRGGVWVCDMKLAIALAVALRANLESIANERALAVGKNEKMEIIYAYLTGVEFKQRVEAIVEAFSCMKNGLEKEKLAYQKIWAEREKQIQKVLNNTVGLYGDLSSLAPVQQIKMLELGESE